MYNLYRACINISLFSRHSYLCILLGTHFLHATYFTSSHHQWNTLIRFWGFLVFLFVIILVFTEIEWILGRKSSPSILMSKFLGSHIFSFNDSTEIREAYIWCKFVKYAASFINQIKICKLESFCMIIPYWMTFYIYSLETMH